MDAIGPAVVAATAFVWLGMVLGISFLEAPLKFWAPGVTLQLGLGIGRLVFGALNAVELGLAVVLVAALAWGRQVARRTRRGAGRAVGRPAARRATCTQPTVRSGTRRGAGLALAGSRRLRRPGS